LPDPVHPAPIAPLPALIPAPAQVDLPQAPPPEPQSPIPSRPVSPAPAPAVAPATPPVALRRGRRERRPPGEWWKIRTPAPIIPDDSSSEDELNVIDQDFEDVQFAGLAVGATMHRP
jgi:hypothetical protein